jgi:hypothetical protein
MSEIDNIKKEIKKIQERNIRVEKDKTWETSWARRISITIITYILITLFLIVIKVERPFLSAIIPAIAYLLSTVSLGFIKNWWITKNA